MDNIKLTAFQCKVYRAVLEIPLGQVRSYKWVAQRIKRPRATRAVARALKSNPFGLIIPCHRVIYVDGRLGGYRWGVRRKRRLQEQERDLIKKIKKLDKNV